jgi:hypothetical protein
MIAAKGTPLQGVLKCLLGRVHESKKRLLLDREIEM